MYCAHILKSCQQLVEKLHLSAVGHDVLAFDEGRARLRPLEQVRVVADLHRNRRKGVRTG